MIESGDTSRGREFQALMTLNGKKRIAKSRLRVLNVFARGHGWLVSLSLARVRWRRVLTSRGGGTMVRSSLCVEVHWSLNRNVEQSRMLLMETNQKFILIEKICRRPYSKL